MAIHIASVEDNQAQSELIREILVSSGYECASFSSGDAFVKALRDRTFDLLLLDWQLPDISGIQLVSWVRQTVGPALPVLFLTNRSLEDDVVRGLAAGADDYVVKPVRRAELVARVGALLRRAAPRTGESLERMRVGPYAVDPLGRVLTLHGLQVELSPREFDLALYLFRNVGKLVPRELIEQAVWGRSIGPDSRTLATHISKLRLKLDLNQKNGVRLVSVYSHGYRLETTQENAEAH
ncbi:MULTISPECIES: response regulator transcription factor [Ralstonia solanacearum species complex]|uniref:Phosphate regulon transcriptional regulatory protein PhoB n=4 Tax=Ralstonia solanacearum species complex TaxID=3116862 RepID=A0A0K1ZLQ5_RALSL|nr:MULTISPECIES: response regulator [Ralstonia]AKZ26911.1 transcriptional regulator [Ralstonia solanacearum]APC68111.1 DNA-binding response regulator [Ralstonia solanacearum OE1-1]APF87566.1 DNA-binding response regulator [Ralstonia solanacearum FJAT-1458]ARS55670.1 DNA-binding response regulator [Ralstonia solanacearum FJAT-91]ESS48778.1 two-component system response regulator transcription regulator protein [Ralstonia solanacearum SD54]CBJ38236.1 putative two-component system response, resp